MIAPDEIGADTKPGLVSARPTADRRVRRTKTALGQAIVDLVLDKGYEAVTIDHILERADVTRATFYAHYRNKEDLLADVVDGFAAEVLAAFGPGPAGFDDSRPADRLRVLFEQAVGWADLVRLIVRGEGDGIPLRRFTAIIQQVLEASYGRPGVPEVADGSRLDQSLITRMRVAQIVAAVGWYVDHEATRAHHDPNQRAGRARVLAASVTRAMEEGWHWAAHPSR